MLRAGLVSILGRVLGIGLQLLNYFYLTRVVATPELGLYYLIMSQAALATFLLSSPLAHWIIREGVGLHRDGQIFSATLKLSLLCLPLGLVPLCAAFLTVSWASAGLTAIATIPLWFAGNAASTLASSGLNVVGHRGLAITITLAQSGLQLLGALLFIHWMGRTGAWLALGATAGVCVAGLFGLGTMALTLGNATSWKMKNGLRSAWAFLWPMAVQGGLSWGHSQGFRVTLAAALDTSSVAMFQTSFSAGALPLTAADGVVVQVLLPKLMTEVDVPGSRRKQALQWFGRSYSKLLWPAIIGAIAAGHCVVRLLAGPQYQKVATIAVWASASEGIRLIATVFFWAAITDRKTIAIAKATAIGSTVTLVGTFLLGKYWGLNGVGLGLVLGATAYLLGLRKVSDDDLRLRTIFPKPTLVIGAISLAAALVARQLLLGVETKQSAFYCLLGVGVVCGLLLIWLMRSLKLSAPTTDASLSSP